MGEGEASSAVYWGRLSTGLRLEWLHLFCCFLLLYLESPTS